MFQQNSQNSFTKTSDKLVAYAKEAIDASKEYAACYKVQIACYEAEGLSGMVAYQQIVSYIRSIGEIVIADVKRGDIGSTAGLYAKGHLSGDFEADVVTLSPYMGKDAISPYFDFFAKDKGAFVLAKKPQMKVQRFSRFNNRWTATLHECASELKRVEQGKSLGITSFHL